MPAHRRRRSFIRRFARGFLGSAAAVLLVAIVVGVIYQVRNKDDSSTVNAADAKTPSASFTTASISPSTSEIPSAAPSTSAPETSVPATPTTPTASVIAPGSRGTLYVYPGPGAQGKVDLAVSRLTAAGYVVNQRKAVALNPAQTTVYYDSGMSQDAASVVAANLGVMASAPRPPEYISTGTLFVVVTSNFS